MCGSRSINLEMGKYVTSFDQGNIVLLIEPNKYYEWHDL